MPSKGKAPKPTGLVCSAFNNTMSDADQTLGVHICYNFLEGLRVVSIIRLCESASFQIRNATIYVNNGCTSTREAGGCAYADNRPLRETFEKALNELKFMLSRPGLM